MKLKLCSYANFYIKLREFIARDSRLRKVLNLERNKSSLSSGPYCTCVPTAAIISAHQQLVCNPWVHNAIIFVLGGALQLYSFLSCTLSTVVYGRATAVVRRGRVCVFYAGDHQKTWNISFFYKSERNGCIESQCHHLGSVSSGPSSRCVQWYISLACMARKVWVKDSYTSWWDHLVVMTPTPIQVFFTSLP